MAIEEDLNLHKIMIQTVEKQISDNDPPAAREAYERLVSKGNDEETAKDMIASLIAEEIYIMMKNDQKMNLENYISRLEKLE
jgi:hypothetical protein